MALINCPECLSKVSDRSFFCPHCGHPFQPLPAPPVLPDPSIRIKIEPFEFIDRLPLPQASFLSCPYCGSAYPVNALYCPQCRQNLRRSPEWFYGSILVIVLTVIYLGLASWTPPSKPVPARTVSPAPVVSPAPQRRAVPPPSPPTPHESVHLAADMAYNNLIIFIQNRDPFPWQDIEITINESLIPFTDDYEFHIEELSPGETAVIATTDFVLSDGTRFNGFATKIKSLGIFAQTPRGFGFSIHNSN